MNSVRMKVVFIQTEESQGTPMARNLRLQALQEVTENPTHTPPYGASSLSLVLSGDEGAGIAIGDEFDVTLSPASGT